MPGAARQGDAIQGTTAGEHNGHATPHGPLPITGTISGGCSGDVFINGRPAAYVGSTTTENDACCGSSQGSIAQGSSSVFINGVLDKLVAPPPVSGTPWPPTMAPGPSLMAAGTF